MAAGFNLLLFVSLWLAKLDAQPLPVISMQMTPDQIAVSLRDRRPLMPPEDCKALNLWECRPDEPARVTDISIRRLRLGEGPELSAVLVAKAKVEHSYVAYVFNKEATWNLVGSFVCVWERCDPKSLIRVEKLTKDSPPLLLCLRDLGGSGSTILTTEGFQLHDGKLWPALNITNRKELLFPGPYLEKQQVLASENRLVIHTVIEEPPGKNAQHECDVWRWNSANHRLDPVEGEFGAYCDPRTGKPIRQVAPDRTTRLSIETQTLGALLELD